MNERIEGLWWKARIGYNNQSCDPEVLEKFAESIIRECDKYVAERWDICEPWMNPGDLLKHFGVEE